MVGVFGGAGGDLVVRQPEKGRILNDQRKGRLMLFFLLAVFVLPIVIGLALYATDWHPAGKSYGELLQPARRLDFSVLPVEQARKFADQGRERKWHLIYVATGSCGADCRNHLHLMRQIHAALAKEIDRLERVWVIDAPIPSQQLKQVQTQYPDLIVIPDAAALAKQFELPGATEVGNGNFYLTDPLDNLMMKYPPGADPNGIRKDLMRLLKYSWAG
jgi:hypothetical protein